MDRLSRLAFVLAQLSTYAGDKKAVNSESTFVQCPYHTEATPSFRIFHSPASKSPGYGKCYGCGASHPWNEFAQKLGLKGWESAKPSEVFASSLRLEEEIKPEKEELTFTDLPRDKVWRSIPTNFMITTGAMKCTNQWGTSMVWMPVNVLGRQRGYLKARLRKEKDKPSYINSKGTWSRDTGLFLYDFVREMYPKLKTVVLVEGPRDGLRLNYLNIPTISILGTQSWSPRKTRYMELLGVDRVILCMDGDDAGQAAIEKITPLLEPQGLEVINFSLTGSDSPYHEFADQAEPSKAAKAAGVSLWDPMSMPLKKVNQLRKLLNDR